MVFDSFVCFFTWRFSEKKSRKKNSFEKTLAHKKIKTLQNREKLGIARTHLALNDEAQGNYRPAAAYIGVLFVSFWILLSYMVCGDFFFQVFFFFFVVLSSPPSLSVSCPFFLFLSQVPKLKSLSHSLPPLSLSLSLSLSLPPPTCS